MSSFSPTRGRFTLTRVAVLALAIPFAAKGQETEAPIADAEKPTGIQRYQNLENRYWEKVDEVQKPVIDAYLASLEALKSTYIRDGKSAEAAKVDNEIAWVKSAPWKSRSTPASKPEASDSEPKPEMLPADPPDAVPAGERPNRPGLPPRKPGPKRPFAPNPNPDEPNLAPPVGPRPPKPPAPARP